MRSPFAIIVVLVLLGGGAWFFLAPQSPFNQVDQTGAPETSTTGDQQMTPTDTTSTAPPNLDVDENGLSRATVTIKTEKGQIKFKFYTNDAPKTVNRIVELVNKGFYNGLTFHRVEPGFVIQGGDPNGNGTGGSGQKLKAEFNARNHVEGAVAMARSADPDSADSQFYITLGRFPHLDGQYTVFGQVVEGMEVARKIVPSDKMNTVSVQ